MKVVIAEWLSYVPDCPADLEVTDDEVLGVFVEDERLADKVQAARDLYKRGYIEEAMESDGGHYEGPHPDCTDAEFEVEFDGYFNDRGPYELDEPVVIWVTEAQS